MNHSLFQKTTTKISYCLLSGLLFLNIAENSLPLSQKAMNKVAISVIVPIYNAEAYLQACLDSLRSQSFTDFEVWLIDDGSQDRSGAICDSFTQQDTRFQVVHKSNGGVSSARNKGLEQANGDWICFVDADDEVGSDYLRQLYQATTFKESQLIIQGFQTLLPNQKQFRTFREHIYRSDEVFVAFQQLRIHRCGFPFGKLYSSTIINEQGLRFDEEIHYAEDVMFMLHYLCFVSSIHTIEGAEYHYYIRNNSSLSQRIFSFESEYRCYQTYLNLMQKLQLRFHLPSIALLSVNNVISEYLVRRSIGSLYQHHTRKSKQERLEVLRSLNTEQISFLQTYYKECNWFHKVTVYLLSKHYYYLCDLLNEGIALGRYFKQKYIKR